MFMVYLEILKEKSENDQSTKKALKMTSHFQSFSPPTPPPPPTLNLKSIPCKSTNKKIWPYVILPRGPVGWSSVGDRNTVNPTLQRQRLSPNNLTLN